VLKENEKVVLANPEKFLSSLHEHPQRTLNGTTQSASNRSRSEYGRLSQMPVKTVIAPIFARAIADRKNELFLFHTRGVAGSIPASPTIIQTRVLHGSAGFQIVVS
jgi:hypothetical protein